MEVWPGNDDDKPRGWVVTALALAAFIAFILLVLFLIWVLSPIIPG